MITDSKMTSEKKIPMKTSSISMHISELPGTPIKQSHVSYYSFPSQDHTKRRTVSENITSSSFSRTVSHDSGYGADYFRSRQESLENSVGSMRLKKRHVSYFGFPVEDKHFEEEECVDNDVFISHPSPGDLQRPSHSLDTYTDSITVDGCRDGNKTRIVSRTLSEPAFIGRKRYISSSTIYLGKLHWFYIFKVANFDVMDYGIVKKSKLTLHASWLVTRCIWVTLWTQHSWTSYYNSSNVCVFITYLLRGPLTDLRHTWWVYVGGLRNCP